MNNKLNPDDPNQNPPAQTPTDAGGQAPGAPTDQPASPPTPEKCVTCGGASSGGNCVPCGQGQISCTCPPAQPPGGEQSGPTQPVV